MDHIFQNNFWITSDISEEPTVKLVKESFIHEMAFYPTKDGSSYFLLKFLLILLNMQKFISWLKNQYFLKLL